MKARAIVRAVLQVAIGYDVGVFVLEVSQGHYDVGAWIALLVVVLTAWLGISAKINTLLEARLGEAVAQRRIAEITLLQIEAAVRRGDHVEVTVDASAGPRVN